MIKIVVTAVIALLLGAIAVRTFIPAESPDGFTNSEHKTLERIRVLENRLDAEIENRKHLQELFDEERSIRLELANRVAEISNEISDAQTVERAITDSGGVNAPRLNRSSFGLPDTEEQISTLVNAGFDEDVAERVVELETQMYQSIINARFGGTQTNPRDVVLESQRTIREDLGDDQYELYLETTGRPTTVPVAAIAENSAGAAAGLQVGDEIVSYDGERVFSLLDLQQSTQTGTTGQTVIVDVKRGDSVLSMAIPRGQIGISTGRTGFGFNRRRAQ